MVAKERISKIRLTGISLIVATLSIGGTLTYFMLLSNKYAHRNAELSTQLAEVESALDKLESSLLATHDYQAQIEDVARATMAFDSRHAEMRANVQAFMLNYSRKARLIGASPEVVSRLDRVRESVVTNEQMLRALSTLLSHSRVFLESIPSITPAAGEFSSGYGLRKSPFTREVVLHRGLDIGAEPGSAVRATADGKVIYAGKSDSFGKLVIVEHEFGIVTKYAHNSKILVRKGQKIQRGQRIALVGSTGRSTGPHLHYEVWVNDRPVDPSGYLLDQSTGDYFAQAESNANALAIGGEEFSFESAEMASHQNEAIEKSIVEKSAVPSAQVVSVQSVPAKSDLIARPVLEPIQATWRPTLGFILVLFGGLALGGLVIAWRRLDLQA